METQLDEYSLETCPKLCGKYRKAAAVILPIFNDDPHDLVFVESRSTRRKCLFCEKNYRSDREFCSDICAYRWFDKFNKISGNRYKVKIETLTKRKKRKAVKKSTTRTRSINPLKN